MAKALIRWSVEHPHAIVAFYIGVFLLFLAGLPFLPLRMMPYVESPMVAVITRYMGLTPREVETYLTKPIEEKMTNIRGVRYIRSTSMDGVSLVSVQFPYGWNMRKAYNDVQIEVQLAMGDLPYDPANLKPPWVIPIDPLNLPVLTLALTGSRWDPVKLREFADNTVVDTLKTVPGVESVYAFGGLKRQAQLVVNRNKLAAYGISILDLKKILDSYNVNVSAGTLTSGPYETTIRYAGQFLGGMNIPEIAIGHGKDSSLISLKDVAKLKDTYAEQRSLYRTNGKEGVEVNVIENPSESSPRVIAAVIKKINDLEKDNPGIHFETAFNQTHFVKIIRDNMTEELLIGIFLTGIALLFFLGEWRGTLIAMITIPTSIGISLLCFFPLGISLNSSTLIGLLLAIGRLVDDSIIDLHNIQRHLKIGGSPREAAIEGTGEVRGAIIAVTLMLVIALLPLIFAGGLTELMFKGINIPFILALLASLLVSMTLTPLLASRLFQPQTTAKKEDWSTRLTGPFVRWLDKLDQRYRTLLKWCLKNKGLILALVGAFFIIPWMLYPYIGSEMMPLADVGQAFLVMEALPGASLQKTAQMAKQLDKILLKHPEVEKVSEEIGNEMGGTYFTGYSMGDVNDVMAMVTFSDKSKRKKNIWELIHEVRSEALRTIPGIRQLTFKEMGADVMASSRAPIEALIYGPSLKKLSDLAEATRKLVRTDPNLHQVSTSWIYAKPEYFLKINPSAAETIGLSPKEIAMQVYYALNGGLTSEYFNPALVRHDTFLIRYDQNQRQNLQDLEDVKITAPNGEVIPLKSVATIVKEYGPSVIEHDNLRRCISVLGYYRKGGPGSMALITEIMMKSILNLPYTQGYGIEMRGDMTEMMDSFTRMFWGMGIAIIFIYLSLAIQFRSFSQALTMMLAIPLELFGSFLALILARQTFSTVSILGFVILNGIVVTASVLVVEFIMILRERGVERDEAILEAATTRLRPILMTVLISLVVLIPVAFAPKTGMDAYSPLGTVVVGGLLTSTFLSLIAVPVMYSLMDEARIRLRQIFLARKKVEA